MEDVLDSRVGKCLITLDEVGRAHDISMENDGPVCGRGPVPQVPLVLRIRRLIDQDTIFRVRGCE